MWDVCGVETMIAKYIRFTDNSKEPGWVGLAVAPNMETLFWVIDEMGDPYSCQLKSVSWRGCAVCFTVGLEEYDGDTLLTSDIDDRELDYGDGLVDAISDDKGWKTPAWPEQKVEPWIAAQFGWAQP